MIEIDPIIVGFVVENPYTIALTLALLKGIAKLTPNVHDDKIATLLINLGGAFRRNKNNKEIE